MFWLDEMTFDFEWNLNGKRYDLKQGAWLDLVLPVCMFMQKVVQYAAQKQNIHTGINPDHQKRDGCHSTVKRGVVTEIVDIDGVKVGKQKPACGCKCSAWNQFFQTIGAVRQKTVKQKEDQKKEQETDQHFKLQNFKQGGSDDREKTF